MAIETSGGSVKIVKIPVAWKLPPAEAMMLSHDKECQNQIAKQRQAEETEGRSELQGYLDMGYALLSAVPVEVSTGTFIIYTLYDAT